MHRRRPESPVEMQIAPMVDVGFLLLIFFMVSGKPQKPESDVGIKLPGTVAQTETLEIPDEQRIEIHGDGRVVLNETVFGEAGDRELPKLVATLRRFKEASVANKTEALVTLVPDDRVAHQRIIDVMNACALAEVHGVTFSSYEEDEESL